MPSNDSDSAWNDERRSRDLSQYRAARAASTGLLNYRHFRLHAAEGLLEMIAVRAHAAVSVVNTLPAVPIDTTQRLNVGSGHDIRDGWVNLDIAPLPGVDVVFNLNDDLPLPFEDDRFTEILCQDVLEHVDLVPVMRELHRVLAPGGRLRIRAPHFSSHAFYIDPTHRRAFSFATFDFFVINPTLAREYYFDFHFSSVEEATIRFHKTRVQGWNAPLERLVNASGRAQRGYEATFLARLFPALNIEVTLRK